MCRQAARVLLAVLATLVAACASTSLRDSWTDPDFRGGPFRKIIVVGATDSPGNRRVFEDIFAERLAATGVGAIRSYTLLPQSGLIPEGEFEAAARGSGADGLLMVRLRRVDTITRVTTTTVPVTRTSMWGFYRGWVSVPEVRQDDLATVETNLFDVRTDRLVWTGITETFNPRSVTAEAPGFADVIITALTANGLLPKR
jgi:hypothetical protein